MWLAITAAVASSCILECRHPVNTQQLSTFFFLFFHCYLFLRGLRLDHPGNVIPYQNFTWHVCLHTQGFHSIQEVKFLKGAGRLTIMFSNPHFWGDLSCHSPLWMMSGCLFGLAVECATARLSTWTGLISWTEPGTNPARCANLGQARML